MRTFKFKWRPELDSYLSNAIAIRVFTDALTDTPCKNGTALHMKAPNLQPVNIRRIKLIYIAATDIFL